MKRLHIERLQVRLKGVDARTADASARLLGPALAARLSPAAGASAGPLSRALAERVAGEVRSRLAPRNPAKKAD